MSFKYLGTEVTIIELYKRNTNKRFVRHQSMWKFNCIKWEIKHHCK
jgi:hypothetical protein